MTTLTPRDDDEMSPDEEEEYETRLARVASAIKHLESTADDLNEIKEKKLYRHKYKTWDTFCRAELQMSGRWALKLKNSSVALQDVTQQIGTIVPILSVAAGSELFNVPSEDRVEVLAAATVDGVATAAGIRQAAKPPSVVDGTGYPIPEKRLAMWNRRAEVQKLLSAVSNLRGTVQWLEDSKKKGVIDPLYESTDLQGASLKLASVYQTLHEAMPYAVCPDCQGHKSETCMSCKGRGFVSKYYWDNALCDESKTLRSMSVSK